MEINLMPMKSICVFCGSATGKNPAYSEAARQLGAELARRQITLVYGGGNIGLMGVVADAALAAGGKVVGVIPEFMIGKEIAHPGVTEMRVVASMHERKAVMADLSDGFIALPGGFGTLEEFTEVLTWRQLKLHHKPFGILNVGGFYDHFLKFLDHAVAEGLIKAKNREMVMVEEEAGRLVERMGEKGGG
jgi:uncharacterized protein (TIGR00730 family)